jgi:hypothetical protein
MNSIDLILVQLNRARAAMRQAKSLYRYELALEDVLDLNQELNAALKNGN